MMLPLFILASLLATCHGSDHGIEYNIYPLRMKTGAGGHYIPEVSCRSWMLGVEAHNIIEWSTVPLECETYVGNYMLGDQYRSDSKTVNRESYYYARDLNLTNDGKNIWIFDVDETVLSNLPFYAQNGFGSSEDSGKTAVRYKSAQRTKLIEAGYRIIGNTGDQWSDLLGISTANRTWKSQSLIL